MNLHATVPAFVFLVATVSAATAAPIVWSSPFGTATLLDGGPLATKLSARAQLGTDDETDTLLYTDATNSPAVAETSVGAGPNLVAARAQLNVDESNNSGLLIFGSSRVFSLDGSGLGTAEVAVYLLISLDAPAVIQVLDLTSSIAGSSVPPEAFSLELSASDAAGSTTGAPLLSLRGANSSGEGGSVVSSSAGYFLLTMRATAGPAADARTDFSFRFDIASVESVPEPGTVALVGVAIGLAGFLRWARRGQRSEDTPC